MPINTNGRITSTPYIVAEQRVGASISLAFFARRIPAEIRLTGPAAQRIFQSS
jgi:hypothetical protein